MSEEMIDYRQRLIEAAQIVKDEKVLRRCWKILDRAYDKQPMTQEELEEAIRHEESSTPSHQERIIRTIRQLKPINVYRVLVVAETLKTMEKEASTNEG